MMLYNIVFTSWPVLTFGVLDQVGAIGHGKFAKVVRNGDCIGREEEMWWLLEAI